MRKNLPVTNHEIVMKDNQVIISETDLSDTSQDIDVWVMIYEDGGQAQLFTLT